MLDINYNYEACIFGANLVIDQDGQAYAGFLMSNKNVQTEGITVDIEVLSFLRTPICVSLVALL